MPNWCSVDIKIKGTKKDVKKFCGRFVFEEDEGKDRVTPDRKYFARSFAECPRDSLMDDIDKKYKGGKFCFSYNCAWSATSCLIVGYPNDWPKECITLVDACKEVSVVLDTEEPGMGFSEHITCNKAGVLHEDCIEWVDYKCKKCGEMNSGHPERGPDYCWECDGEEFERAEK